jgi:hypothetical protein
MDVVQFTVTPEALNKLAYSDLAQTADANDLVKLMDTLLFSDVTEMSDSIWEVFAMMDSVVNQVALAHGQMTEDIVNDIFAVFAATKTTNFGGPLQTVPAMVRDGRRIFNQLDPRNMNRFLRMPQFRERIRKFCKTPTDCVIALAYIMAQFIFIVCTVYSHYRAWRAITYISEGQLNEWAHSLKFVISKLITLGTWLIYAGSLGQLDLKAGRTLRWITQEAVATYVGHMVGPQTKEGVKWLVLMNGLSGIYPAGEVAATFVTTVGRLGAFVVPENVKAKVRRMLAESGDGPARLQAPAGTRANPLVFK